MTKIKILCICTIVVGVLLFSFSYFVMSPSSYLFRWMIGLASALIILGLGYLINVLIMIYDSSDNADHSNLRQGSYRSFVKERSGYLVCKIMSILLCIYLLVLNEINTRPIIMILGIALVVVQFALDLIFQLYYLSRNKDEQDS